jgi:hypothetical protein
MGAACVVAGVLAWPVAAPGATMIDGGQYVDGQVWTPAGSPYVVAGTIGVRLDAELRIEAGTEVQFNTGAFQIEGLLTIAGTAAAPVIIRASTSGTAVGWTGIQPQGRSAVRISHAIIRNAGVGLRIMSEPTDAQIDRTTFEDCNVGLSIYRGRYAFDSIVARNNGMGIEVLAINLAAPPDVTLTNTVVQGTTGIGVVAKNGALLTIINSTIDANKIGMVGYISPAPTIVLRNTILSNNPQAIYVDETSTSGPPMMTATQTTFWQNRQNLVHMGGTNPPSLDGTTPLPGAGNAVADPMYVSATDLHLTAGSPCIDSGSATGAPDHDLDQNARPHGAGFDRGAYEFAPAKEPAVRALDAAERRARAGHGRWRKRGRDRRRSGDGRSRRRHERRKRTTGAAGTGASGASGTTGAAGAGATAGTSGASGTTGAAGTGTVAGTGGSAEAAAAARARGVAQETEPAAPAARRKPRSAAGATAPWPAATTRATAASCWRWRCGRCSGERGGRLDQLASDRARASAGLADQRTGQLREQLGQRHAEQRDWHHRRGRRGGYGDHRARAERNQAHLGDDLGGVAQIGERLDVRAAEHVIAIAPREPARLKHPRVVGREAAVLMLPFDLAMPEARRKKKQRAQRHDDARDDEHHALRLQVGDFHAGVEDLVGPDARLRGGQRAHDVPEADGRPGQKLEPAGQVGMRGGGCRRRRDRRHSICTQIAQRQSAR